MCTIFQIGNTSIMRFFSALCCLVLIVISAAENLPGHDHGSFGSLDDLVLAFREHLHPEDTTTDPVLTVADLDTMLDQLMPKVGCTESDTCNVS